MARTLEQILRQEKPAVVQQAKKQAAKIIAEMDKKTSKSPKFNILIGHK